MKILVCISHVPDTTTKISFTADNKSIATSGIQYIINPYDEIALTRALELTEKSGGTVTVINVGDATTDATLRKALAIGATDAVRIDANPANAYFTPPPAGRTKTRRADQLDDPISSISAGATSRGR